MDFLYTENKAFVIVQGKGLQLVIGIWGLTNFVIDKELGTVVQNDSFLIENSSKICRTLKLFVFAKKSNFGEKVLGNISKEVIFRVD